MDIMTKTNTKEVLSRIETWPQEDQEELAELAREIEARRSGVYVLDEEESAAIREGLAELDRGEWVSEEQMKSFWKRCGVI
jgi:predicted transcriptional regulator